MGKWWLIGGGALLAALLVGSVALALLSNREATFAPGTPEAAAQALLRAAEADDFGAAYNLMAQELRDGCSLERFADNGFGYRVMDGGDFQVRLENTRVVDDTAFVSVEITEYYGGEIYGGGGWTRRHRYALRLEGGEWKFSSYPWPYQSCDFGDAPEPVPTPTPEPTPATQ